MIGLPLRGQGSGGMAERTRSSSAAFAGESTMTLLSSLTAFGSPATSEEKNFCVSELFSSAPTTTKA